MKECTKCKEILSNTFFNKDKNTKSGLHPQCKSCTNARKAANLKKKFSQNTDFYRDRALKNKYGVSLKQRDQMLVNQDYKCKICLVDEIESSRSVLCLDHCHTTGKVRGLLCNGCNSALGHLKDNPTAIKAALAYITNNGDI